MGKEEGVRGGIILADSQALDHVSLMGRGAVVPC